MIEEVFGQGFREWVVDFLRYMNTSIPRGVDSKKFTDLTYSNKSKLDKLHVRYGFLDKTLVEDVALKEFLQHSDEEIIALTRPYFERPVDLEKVINDGGPQE